MQIVDVADAPPGYCAVLGRSGGPFVDTGSEIPSMAPHIYVSEEAVKLMAKMFGMVEQTEHQEALDLTTGLEQACNELEADLKEANRVIDAAEYLKSKKIPVH